MTEHASIGSMLRAGRLQKGLTEEELGARVGQSAADVSRYESGEAVPDAETMAALTAELKASSTGAKYVPKHSSGTAPVAPEMLDAEPVWETLSVDGAVPALPPVAVPPEEQEPEEPTATSPAPNGPISASWSGSRPWADPMRVLAEVPTEESILPLDEPPFPGGLRAVDGLRPALDGEVGSSSVTAIAVPPLLEDETRRNPAVDITTIAIPKTVPDRPRSYLDLPGERSRYRVRAIVTLVGLVALIYVISWAMGRAGDLFDAILDTIRSVT